MPRIALTLLALALIPGGSLCAQSSIEFGAWLNQVPFPPEETPIEAAHEPLLIAPNDRTDRQLTDMAAAATPPHASSTRLPEVTSPPPPPDLLAPTRVRFLASAQTENPQMLADPDLTLLPSPPQAADRLTLAEAESLALALNPSLAEAEARVRAARGAAFQAGLPPNPKIYYQGNEMGNEDAAGQHGMAFSQEFVRGRKLQLSRAAAAQEAARMEQELLAQRQRVLTDVRIAFFNVYLAQRRVELAEQLSEIGTQGVEMTERLFEGQVVARTDVLQSEMELARAQIDVQRAAANQQAAWRRLSVLVGRVEWPVQRVDASTDAWPRELTWDAAWQRLLADSPQLSAAAAEVQRASFAVRRAYAEPVSNVTAQAGVQFDEGSQDTFATVQLGMPLPLWNRNQGGITQAQGELIAARRRLEVTELRLESQLATVFQAYQSARAEVDTLRSGILPNAQQSLDLAQQGYEAGEFGYLELLTVQRTYFRANLEYLDALAELNRSVRLIEGMLLEGSLNQP